MSRNGSGGYSLPSNSWNPALNGAPATAEDWQALINDIAAAIQQSISADGQTTITGNLQMGGNKLTNLAAGSGTGQSLRYEQLFSQGTLTDIASSAITDIGAPLTSFLRVTGATGITSFGSNYNGPRFLIFSGSLLLTHSSSLVLPGAANITTAANDALIAVPISGGWQVVAYTRSSGIPAGSGANTDITSLGNNTSTIYTTAGTSTAYTITPNPAITAYAAGQSFVVNFNAASGASPTIAISGVATPPSLVRQDVTGAYVNIQAGDIPINHRSRVTLISTTQALVEELPPVVNQIQPVTASVAGNALTVGLNPTTLEFRSTTLTTGVPVKRTVPTAISLVVPNTATLGTVSGVASRIILVAIDNAGAVELAVINLAGGTNLDETGVISTTAISGAATSASVFYSTTARTGVPYRVIGCVDSTQATAGTWATAPSLVQGMGGNALDSMQSLGFGQAWQSLSVSSGVTQYNTTGKPITLFINATSNVTINSITINGYNLTPTAIVTGASTQQSIGGITIPVGASFAVNYSGSVNFSVLR